ncbi:MAG: hypothetical protein ACJ70Y_06475, partial [Nitrososphaera sp.]
LLTKIYSACPVGSRLHHTSPKFMFFEIKAPHYNMCGMVENTLASRLLILRCLGSYAYFAYLKSKEDMIFKVRKDARVTDIQREFGTSFAQF